MHELKSYIATIQNQDCDLFDIILDRISHQSNVRPGNRLTTIIPKSTETTYEVSLSEEEAAVLALSCPGEYIIYSAKGIEEAIKEYVGENA